jgi:hypothetical protein
MDPVSASTGQVFELDPDHQDDYNDHVDDRKDKKSGCHRRTIPAALAARQFTIAHPMK